MNVFSILRPWWKSFYSADFYRQVAWQWSGIAVWHLLLLSVLISLPNSIFINSMLHDFYAKTAVPIIEQFPTVTITQGRVSIDKPLPYAIKGAGEEEPYIVFLNEERLSEDATLPATVVVTQRVIYSDYFADRPAIVRELDNEDSREITPQQAEEMLLMAKRTVLYGVFFLLIILIFAFALLIVIFTGLFGRFLGLFMGVRLTQRQFMRLAVVACTPAVLLGCLLSLFGLAFDFSTLPVLVGIGYYVFAVYNCRGGFQTRPTDLGRV